MKNAILKIKDFLYRLPLIQALGLRLIIGLLVSAACLAIFSSIAEDVVEKERIVAVDLAVANALHAAATPASIGLYKALSLLGLEVLWLVGFLVGLFFISRRQWLRLTVWIAAPGGGLLLNNLLKILFARPRPSFTDPLAVAQNYSFPSGHAMLSLVGYGMIAYFVWSSVPNRRLRILLIFACALLVILIGISRMSLGLHYLSDVVAGFAAGGLWLATCITAMNSITRRRQRREQALNPSSALQSSSKA